jgi:hypothetical protein
MLRLDKMIKPWKEASALNNHVDLYGFWNATTFLTKSGDLGVVLSVPGVDYECLDRAAQDYGVKRLEAALKAFGPGFHIYQYLFKSNPPGHTLRALRRPYRGGIAFSLPNDLLTSPFQSGSNTAPGYTGRHLVSANYVNLSFFFTILAREKRDAYLDSEYLAVLETGNATPYFLNLYGRGFVARRQTAGSDSKTPPHYGGTLMAACGPEKLRPLQSSASFDRGYGRTYSDLPTSKESAHTYGHRVFPNAFKRNLPAVLDSDDVSLTLFVWTFPGLPDPPLWIESLPFPP